MVNMPTWITEEHHEVFYYWQKCNLYDMTLLHIDAHPDMFGGSIPDLDTLIDDFYRLLTIGNFICAAVHYNMIDSIYWLNPHSERLFDLGTTRKETERINISTKSWSHSFGWDYWTDEVIEKESWKILSLDGFKISNDYILDVDLDSFCCNRFHFGEIANNGPNYDGINNYKSRIDNTINFLRQLKRPELITVTRSQGSDPYVPPLKVDSVQRYLIRKLNEIF